MVAMQSFIQTISHWVLFFQGKAMESGTAAGHVRERKHKRMEEFLGSTFPILVLAALLMGLEKIT
jgi:ABC-type polar amino acid transport system ATPase subunit